MVELDRELLDDGWYLHPGEYKVAERVYRTKTGEPLGFSMLALIKGRWDKIQALADPECRWLVAGKRDEPLNRLDPALVADVRERAGESWVKS